MKVKYMFVIYFFVFLMPSNLLLGQSNSKISYFMEAGLNYGASNSAINFAQEYLENEDYNSRGASSDPALGLNLDFGIYYRTSKRSEVKIATGYLLSGTQVLGTLNDLNSSINRPLSPDIPIRVEGRVNSSMLSFSGDFIFNVNGNYNNGFYISAGMGYLFHLNTDWKTDVEFETGSFGVQNNLSDIVDTDLNNVILTNLKLGYNIILNEKYRITPSFGFNLGLNEFSTEDSLSPNFFSFGIRFNRIRG